jgi:tripartite ATP-independent transporter DctM subunit
MAPASSTESGPPGSSAASEPAGSSAASRSLDWAIALLVAAQAAVVGLQVVGRHLLHSPLPWTEEIARLLLVWLMCVGGIRALQESAHPRVTAIVRLLPPLGRAAVDRGLQIVLLAFFLCLLVPAWRLTVSSAGERLPASGISGAAISLMLPAALLLMSAVLVQQLRASGGREAVPLAWSLGTAGLVIASVLVPLVAGAMPLLVMVIGFLVTAALGLPLAFTLVLTSATYLVGIGGVSLTILPIKLLGGVDSFVLLAIPLFILAGALMESGAISERIVDLAMAIVGRVRGGLAMVVVVAEVLFSGISGSTAADVSAISSLLVPSMKRAGYSGAEAVSVVSAASAMGILVPPCLTMVVLGSLVNLSIVTLFLAGFLPAFLLAAMLLVLIAVRARRQGWPVAERASRADLGRATRRAVVPLGLPILLFGGIFTGITTVTEAALVAVVYALVVGVATGGIGRANLVRLFERSGVVTATTLWVLAAASAFAWILVREWVPQTLGEWIIGLGASRALFLALTLFVFVVIGALLEGLPALLIFGPILFPISRTVGVDPVHYGIVIVAAMGIAFFLPPVGVGLSIASGIARVDVDEVSRAYWPYLVVLLVGLALIAALPGLTLALPRAILGYRG